jgi:hypothetical protein
VHDEMKHQGQKPSEDSDGCTSSDTSVHAGGPLIVAGHTSLQLQIRSMWHPTKHHRCDWSHLTLQAVTVDATLNKTALHVGMLALDAL